MPTLYLSNRPSQLNKDILTYMDSNLKSIVKMGLYIEFEVALPEDTEKYTQMGIVNFPTIVHQNKSYVGVEKIKGFLNYFHKSYQTKKAKRTEGDDINDYWSNILSKGEDDDEADDQAEQMKNKAQKAVQDRQHALNSRKPGKPGAPRNVPARPSTMPDPEDNEYPSRKASNVREPPASAVVKNMGSSGQEAIDDQLMAKFFENQMETDL
jgi:hypothetical protein